MLWSVAYAQSEAARQPNALESMLPILVMIGVFYFFVIRPQMKKQKEHQTFLNAMKRGDQVLTTGGILGRVDTIGDQYVTLEIADDVKVKILRNQIMGTTTKEKTT